jgi:hypothetical protein
MEYLVDFYDAIFKLGEYYVSIMSFEDPEFVNKRNINSTILNDLRKEKI